MKNIAWNWKAVLMLLFPVLVVVTVIVFKDVHAGLLLGLGILPAVLIPLPPTRKKRIMLPLVGLAMALAIIAGSLLAQIAIVAVVVLCLAAFFSSRLSASKKYASTSAILLALILPLIAIGLSYTDPSETLSIGAFIVAGTILTYIFSLLLPETEVSKKPPAQPVPLKQAKEYGFFLAAATLLATTIPFAFGWDHVGWVTGATLFVMRPRWNVEKERVIGRIVSVSLGAFIASLLLWANLPVWAIALLIGLTIILAGATQGSRWYIAPFFTTFIVFYVLLYGLTQPGQIEYRFNERIIETLVGVSIAVLCSLAALGVRSGMRRARS